MIKLTDFQVGQTAYMVETLSYGKNRIHEVTVTSIGRKYVHVKAYERRLCFGVGGEDDCLQESCDSGLPATLYITREVIERKMEREALQRWFRDMNPSKLSLESLRAIKAIVDADVAAKKGEYEK